MMEIIASTAIGMAGAFALALIGFQMALYQRMGAVEANLKTIQLGIDRVLGSLTSHEHDKEGRAIFRVPPVAGDK